MALEVMDGFDYYDAHNWYSASGTIVGLQARHPGTPNAAMTNYFVVGGRFGGRALQSNQALFQPQSYFTDNLTSVSTRVVGLAWQAATISGMTQPWPTVGFLLGGAVQCYFGVDSGGHIFFQVGSTLVATSSNNLIANTWYYLQFKVKCNPSAGTYEARVTQGGITTPWLSGSGNTANTGLVNSDSVSVYGTNSTSNVLTIDDYYVLNTSGSINNDFLGECRIITMFPSGNGAVNNLTPSTASPNWQNASETLPDFDSSYNSGNTTGQIDLYTYPAIAPTGAIAGVQVQLSARKDDAGARSACIEYRHGTNNYDGTNIFSPGSDYRMGLQMYETDPATGVPWTAVGVNSGQFGIKLLV